MIAIDLHDATTQLPRLLERVSRGKRLLITKHGLYVAQLIPAEVGAPLDLEEHLRCMQEWQEREGPTLGRGLTISKLREEGRRF